MSTEAQTTTQASNVAAGDKTYPHVLGCERFERRSLQTRWQLRLLGETDLAKCRAVERSESTGRDLLDELYEAVGMLLVSATGPHYTPDKSLRSQLTMHEAWELYHAGMARQELTGDDVKN